MTMKKTRETPESQMRCARTGKEAHTKRKNKGEFGIGDVAHTERKQNGESGIGVDAHIGSKKQVWYRR